MHYIQGNMALINFFYRNFGQACSDPMLRTLICKGQQRNSVYCAIQVVSPLPEHSNLRLTNERTVNHMTLQYLILAPTCAHVYIHMYIPFTQDHWSTSSSNVPEVDNQLEKHGNL